MYDFTPIIQVIAFLGAGVGAATFVDRKISALEKSLNSKIAGLEKKIDNSAKNHVSQRECGIMNKNMDQRIDKIEMKVGDMAQKAQIIVAAKALGNL